MQDITNPFTNQPVANIPTASLDPTALAYFKLFPLPNQVGTGAVPYTVNNFILYDPTSSLYSNLGDVRLDHHFSASDTVFARYSYNKTTSFSPPSFPNANGVAAGGALQGNGSGVIVTNNGAAGYTHIFTPSLLMELRMAYTLFNLDTTTINQGHNYNDQAPYLIPNANECNQCSGLATVYPIGYGALGDSVTEPGTTVEHNTQFAGNVTLCSRPPHVQNGGWPDSPQLHLGISHLPKRCVHFPDRGRCGCQGLSAQPAKPAHRGTLPSAPSGLCQHAL